MKLLPFLLEQNLAQIEELIVIPKVVCDEWLQQLREQCLLMDYMERRLQD